MFLKVVLLFLHVILVVAALHPDQSREKTDAEIIEEAFNGCKKWSKDYELSFESVSEMKYYWYMGDNKKDWTFIKSYLEDLKPEKPDGYFYIDAQLFSKLFETHCKRLEVSIKEFAKKRKDATEKKEICFKPLMEFFNSFKKN